MWISGCALYKKWQAFGTEASFLALDKSPALISPGRRAIDLFRSVIWKAITTEANACCSYMLSIESFQEIILLNCKCFGKLLQWLFVFHMALQTRAEHALSPCSCNIVVGLSKTVIAYVLNPLTGKSWQLASTKRLFWTLMNPAYSGSWPKAVCLPMKARTATKNTANLIFCKPSTVNSCTHNFLRLEGWLAMKCGVQYLHDSPWRYFEKCWCLQDWRLERAFKSKFAKPAYVRLADRNILYSFQ